MAKGGGGEREDWASNVNAIPVSSSMDTINYCLREIPPSLEALNWSHRFDGKLKSCISYVTIFNVKLSKHDFMEA